MPKSQLVELYAHGLGVIDDARVEFGAGFNVITGETGAGKTLLLGALDLCLGGEGTSSRHALLADMRAAAVFTRADATEVVLTREASSSGRLRSTLNGTASSAEALKVLATELIVIHGQHDSLTLRNRNEILKIIDVSGGVSTTELAAVRAQLREALTTRQALGGDQGARERELEFIEFQISELEGLELSSADELSDRLEELNRLTELREGQAAVAAVLQELDGDSDHPVLARFAALIQRIPASSAYGGVRDSLREALDLARDAVHELSSFVHDEVIDTASLVILEDRVATLQLIARKYGGSLNAALVTLEELHERRSRAFDTASWLRDLDEEIHDLEERAVSLARTAKRERAYAAVRLTEAVRAQLPRVALAHASLRFEVDGDDGSSAQILFTPNPGLGEGPLQSLASGGELSRVLLALSLETAHEDVVAVFDEVDAGLGGQVAQQIGECLREVGRRQQVLAVTHLASVAAKADHHFVIEKVVHQGATSTTVRQVTGEARVREIARMLAGDELTTESQALASRLLETSR